MSLFADRFDIIKLLGRGGMAEVWLAEQKGIRGFARRVVIKQMLSHLAEDREFVRRFEDEARVAALMKHSNVVRVEDFGEASGVPYLVMEYIEGEDLVVLAERAQERGERLPPRLVLQIGIDIARGLHAVHHLTTYEGAPLNVVHRDVSPQNIMVDLEGHAKLLDFGVARAATNQVKTRVGILKGKIAYFSPEQSRGEPLDGRSDQFALGVVLWELLTGHRLFLAQTDVDTLRRVRRGEIPPLRDYLPEASDLLVECVQKVLHPNLLQRFADGNALATHLERCLQELGGRLQGPELQSVLEPLLKGRRSYLPSAPLPGAEAETAFTPASIVAPHDPDDESTSRLTPFDEDPLTLVSQPGFLANFEDDDTLLSNPSLRQLDPSVLRSIPGTADADAKPDQTAQKHQDRDPTVVRPETSGTAPTHTVDELALAPEYSENASFGGPILSVVLMTVLVALAIGAWIILT